MKTNLQFLCKKYGIKCPVNEKEWYDSLLDIYRTIPLPSHSEERRIGALLYPQIQPAQMSNEDIEAQLQCQVKTKPVYQNTCTRCGDKFDTYHKNFKFCPACEEEFKDERRESQKRGKR